MADVRAPAEAGVGRLLTSEERRHWPHGVLRSAFAIGDGYVLTAWHCVRKFGGKSAQFWLRLHNDRTPPRYLDIPVSYADHVAELDAALLVFDEARAVNDGDAVSAAELRRHLDSVALPLGAGIAALDEVRIGGFPESNPAVHCTLFAGKVQSVNAMVGAANAIRVYVPTCAARYSEHPQGMSGGPLLRYGPDGAEWVVGFMSAFPPAPAGKGPLGGEILCRHVADLRTRFPVVGRVLRELHPSGARTGPRFDEQTELSIDVAEAYLPLLLKAGVDPPARWDLAGLEPLRRQVVAGHNGSSRVGDALTFLCQAARAKSVFARLGASGLRLGRLQAIYQREIGQWPAAGHADGLLVEAADVDLSQRRCGHPGPLRALARFMIGLAAAAGTAPEQNPWFRDWIESVGEQPADAQKRYADLRDRAAWLLLDFGDEPTPGDTRWPAEITWTCFFAGSGDGATDVATQRVPCGGSREGLIHALREVLRDIPPVWPLLVDLAVPHALLCEGIEHWPIYPVDGEFESLSEHCRPRLRWSRRRYDVALYRRLIQRTRQAVWEESDGSQGPLTEHVLSDEPKLKEWVRANKRLAWLLGGRRPVGRADPLRVLLREGCGFVIWFPDGLEEPHARQICTAAAGVSAAARRMMIPDVLPAFTRQCPALIWDDPDGREDISGSFRLLPLVTMETI